MRLWTRLYGIVFQDVEIIGGEGGQNVCHPNIFIRGTTAPPPSPAPLGSTPLLQICLMLTLPMKTCFIERHGSVCERHIPRNLSHKDAPIKNTHSRVVKFQLACSDGLID